MQSPTQMIQQHEDYFFLAVYPSAGTGGHSEAVSQMISTSLQTDIAAEVSLSSNDSTEREGGKTCFLWDLSEDGDWRMLGCFIKRAPFLCRPFFMNEN